MITQALIRAHELGRFSSLLANVRGIAFFGTPHRGSDLASWGKMFSRILSTASLGISTNTNIVKELKANSEVLWRISSSFVERGNKTDIRILSFYETEKMPGLGCVVNPIASSTGSYADTHQGRGPRFRNTKLE